MKVRILIISLLLLFGRANAQNQILYQTSQTKSYLLSYTNTYDENQQVINEMLDAIAKFIPKPVYQTKITFTIDENIKITRDKNNLNMFVDLQNLVLTGDIFYKSFNMGDVLLPSKYDFEATLSKPNGASLATFTPAKNLFNPTFNETLLQYTDSAHSNNYKLELNLTRFYYDHEARNRFREKTVLVDQYFIADVDLDNIDKQLQDINPNTIETIDKTQATLNNAKQAIGNIEQAAFWQALHIDTYDPVKLKFKLHKIRDNYNDLQNQTNYTLSVIHQLYYNKGLDLYNAKKIQEAKAAFEKSLYYSATYAPSHYFLARIAFETNNTDEAKQQIKKLFALTNLDETTLKAAKSLAAAIEWTDINTAAALLSAQKFDEALLAINKAATFCQSLPNYTCNDTIELVRRDCHRGIYAQHIKNGNDLFTQKRLNEAQTEANTAMNYQKQYSIFIPDNLAAADLNQKIAIEQYYQTLKRGKDALTAKNFRDAFDAFQSAKLLEDQYPVKKDKLLPDLLKKSKLEVLMLDLDDADQAVATNNLSKARTLLRQVIDDQSVYGLLDNTKLSTRIDGLKKSIFSQECMNAQKEYDTKIAAAKASANQAQYIQAETAYSEAAQLVKNNPDCGINNNEVVVGLKYVEKPAQYQGLLNQCNEFAKSYSYGRAIDAYNNLTTYYNSNGISSYNIVHQPLQLYIASFESGFVMYGVTWYTNGNDLNHAMYLLKLLRQRNVPKAATKLHQTTLARAQAIADYKANLAMNAKLKVTEYTLGDKWYGTFTSEYLKQIKKFK
ncbi:MAG: hypothetical protein WCQ95_13745 [Bacteroidota bacterium]